MIDSRENFFHNLLVPDHLKRGVRKKERTKALREADHLISRVGIGIVEAVEKSYLAYKEKPTEVTARRYRTWRLRLHQRLNNDKKTLESINELRGLGLFDEVVGPTCWDYDFS